MGLMFCWKCNDPCSKYHTDILGRLMCVCEHCKKQFTHLCKLKIDDPDDVSVRQIKEWLIEYMNEELYIDSRKCNCEDEEQDYDILYNIKLIPHN